MKPAIVATGAGSGIDRTIVSRPARFNAVRRVATFRGPGFEALGRLVDALSHPARQHLAALGVVIVYAILWGLYEVVAKSSQGITADMGEMLIWARELALGYPKHPPFLAWLLRAWFTIFPLEDWAYYLLSAINLAAGLYVAFVLAGEWLDGPKRAAVLFLLAVIPFYNFHGLKFDQNSALIPLWGLTIWTFVRSLETRHGGYAALAGLLSALSLLTKYWSVFLLLGLGLAALLDRRRNAYFRSPAPYVSTLVGAAALAPHIYWLVREHFPPLVWVVTRRTSQSVFDALDSLTEYSAGTVGYAGVAIILVLLFVQPSWAGLRDGLFPRERNRRTAAILFWAPLLVPIPVAFATHTNLLSLWNTPALNLLPVVLLGSTLVTATRDQVTRVAAVAISVMILALIASPIVALATLRTGVGNYAAYARPLAQALDHEWKASTDRPLRILAGPFALVSSTAMYVPDRPATFADFSPYLSPWVDDGRIAREGFAIACPAVETWCIDIMGALTAKRQRLHRLDVELTPRYLGFEGMPQRFTIAIIPPP
jgi:4-amino-4-deoxy-L-arabinose transferase-like glycosyltransferase